MLRLINVMRTIFFSIYGGDIEKIYLRSGMMQALIDTGHRVILLIRAKPSDEAKLEYYRKNFGQERVLVELLPPAMTKAELYWYHLSWNSLPTHSAYVKRKDLYLKHRKKVRYFLESAAGWLGRFRFWRSFLRWSYFIVPDAFAAELFDKYKPDLVFAPNMFSPEDCRLLRTARKRKIKTVTTMKSWDVPTTRGFTRVKADRILVFNEINRKETIEIGDYRADQVFVMGFPQFDVYARSETYLSREEFFSRIHADPAKKLILFAIPGDFKHPFINDILIGLDQAITDGRIREPVQVLARFHPKYPSPAEALKDLKHFIMDRPGTYFTQKLEMSTDAPMASTYQWTFTDHDIIHLANSLKHAAVTTNVESTMTLDAVAVGRPVVMIAFDGNQKLDYWHSIMRNYDREHFQAVIRSGGVRLAKTMDEFIRDINVYLENAEADADGRQRMRESVIYKTDGQSAARAARYVMDALAS
jgi:hypothetical protein